MEYPLSEEELEEDAEKTEKTLMKIRMRGMIIMRRIILKKIRVLRDQMFRSMFTNMNIFISTNMLMITLYHSINYRKERLLTKSIA